MEHEKNDEDVMYWNGPAHSPIYELVKLLAKSAVDFSFSVENEPCVTIDVGTHRIWVEGKYMLVFGVEEKSND